MNKLTMELRVADVSFRKCISGCRRSQTSLGAFSFSGTQYFNPVEVD
jgi:hypothetical protein